MAKVEFELSGKKIAITGLFVIIGIAIGLLASGYVVPQGKQTAAANCLTVQDLNRQDLIGVITLSRFCEGMGLVSNVLQQVDANGIPYGLPVCVQPR